MMMTIIKPYIVAILFQLNAGIQSPVGNKTPVWPPSPEPTRIEFLYSFHSINDLGIERSLFRKIFDFIVGADAGEIALVKPLNVSTDLWQNIYITDPGARCIHIINLSDKSYERIEEVNGEPLVSPVTAVCGENGTIYITDSALKIVAAYDKDRNVLFTIKGFFRRPTGLTIFGNKLYVVDTILNKILVFSLTGELLSEYGQRGTGKGEFNFPVFATSGKNLYVVDAMNYRVQEFDDSLHCIRMFGSNGNSQGSFANPKGIALDSDNNIYVCDAMFNAFQIFNAEGRLLLVVGKQGAANGEFELPSGICINSDNKIFVVDVLNRRIQVFQYHSVAAK